MNTATPVTRTDFARLLGVQKSYITALGKSGRLVLDDAGLVRVEETKALIAKTAAAPERSVVRTRDFSEARSQKEQYEAANAKLDFEERCGKLTEVERVAMASATAGTVIRARIEAMPDTLAPQLAPVTDEAQIRAVLADWAETVLAEVSAAFAQLAAATRGKGGADYRKRHGRAATNLR